MADESAEVLFVPELPEELTADWIRQAIGWPVASVEREILGQGVGFLGDIVRLRLTSEDPSVPPSVIAKLPKKENRTAGEMLGVYEREIMFFQDLASSVPARTPTIYFSHFDRDKGSENQKPILRAFDAMPGFMTPLIGWFGARVAGGKQRRYLLIMEDMGDLEVGDQWAGASATQVELALKNIAPTHRAFWGSEKLSELFWLLPMDIDARMRAGMFRASLRAWRANASAAFGQRLDWIDRQGAALMRRFVAEAPATLVHNDLRLDNVCFAADHCAYLDWQMARCGPAAYDVAYLIGGALSADVSHADEKALVREYHHTLDVADHVFETFWRDYQRALMLTAVSIVPTPEIEIDEGRGMEMMDRWRERLTARLIHVDEDALR